MAVTNYYTVNGSIIGEAANGVRTDYLTDALGSVTGTVNSACQVVNTYRYKPYGSLLSKTGVGADPAFGWVGTQGYKQTQKKFSDFYVRARHYDSDTARWTTIDPVFSKNLYAYADVSPVIATDSTGKWVMKNLVASCDSPRLVPVTFKVCNSRWIDKRYPVSCNPDIQAGAQASIACDGSCRKWLAMTGAWPNLSVDVKCPSTTACCPSGRNDTQTCNYGPFTPGNTRKHPTNDPTGIFPEVKCGQKITVKATNKNTKKECSVDLYIIDAGPAPEPSAHADVDLHPAPAKRLYECLFGKPISSCEGFGLLRNVTVTGG